ncbi:hypothetical protein DPMN_102694 [Dreissena polymorpha]|uniref:Uncharacterized protein n=1 Tax=Dreissena polymorpha TaxID=45954 RepID=A0A9D4RA41_DREPO|nr:hypothetical protein DPMN_102694 [Dreissena polymorpha]
MVPFESLSLLPWVRPYDYHGAAAQEEKSGKSVVPGTSRLCATSIELRVYVSGCWPSSTRSGSGILVDGRVQPNSPS